MPKRNQHAVIAQQGACNPIPLIRALQTGLDELNAEQPDGRADTPTILGDPALRLLVHQLAHLFRVNDHGLEGLEFLDLLLKVGMTQ
jgi:hypothetical protein